MQVPSGQVQLPGVEGLSEAGAEGLEKEGDVPGYPEQGVALL